MSDLNRINRRDFLGAALAGPAVAAALGALSTDNRPIYLGGMRELISEILPEPNWRARYYALVESVDAPESEWRAKWTSQLSVIRHLSGRSLPDLLRSGGVAKYCEADISPRPSDPDGPFCFADVTVFDDVSRCEAAWRSLEESTEAGETDIHPGGLGEASCVANKSAEWTVPGKIFFRRANVGVSIHGQFRRGYEADRFAFALDRRIVERLSRTPQGAA